MSDVKNNQEDNTTATGGTQSVEPPTKAGNTEAEKELNKKPNANTEVHNRIAKDLFAKNEGLTEIYFTSDFLPFAKAQDAKKHGEGLSDKKIISVKKIDL